MFSAGKGTIRYNILAGRGYRITNIYFRRYLNCGQYNTGYIYINQTPHSR